MEALAFTAAVQSSKAVMNRTLAALHGWAHSPNPLFQSYFRQVEGGRIANGSEYDEQRTAAESSIEPYAFADLSYAALTIDGEGVRYYGEYSCVLRTVTIEDRASVFERNPFVFNKKHNVVAGKSPPKGYRSDWSKRSDVALAKLHSKLYQGMPLSAFANILLEPTADDPNSDFVEVHVYGPISRSGIELVRGPVPKRRQDKQLWKSASSVMRKSGATVEETS